MNIAKNYYKKESNSERFYQVCEKISPPFCLQMLVEGKGDLTLEQLEEAVNQVSNVNQGTRLILKKVGLKKFWFDSKTPPPVKLVDEKYFYDFDINNTIINNSKNIYFYNRLNVENGNTCEVYLIKGKKIKVLFRALHSVMDARGLLFWAEEVFRYLNNNPLLGTNTKISDIDYYKKFFQKEKIKKVPLESRSPSPLGKTKGNDKHYVWARKKIYGNYSTLVSQLAYLLTQESYKHSDRPVSFMITADMRNKENNFQTTGNLSSPIYLNINKDLSWLDIYKQIIYSFKENIDKQVDKIEDLIHFMPVNLLSTLLKKYLEVLYKKDSYLFSVAISNVGKIDTNNFCFKGFICENIIFLPVDIPAFSISLICVELPDSIELLLSAPSFIANDGRLENLINNLEIGLKELNSSLKVGIANKEEKELINKFNDTITDYPKEKNVIDLFQEQVKLNPDNIAISLNDRKITFKELDEKSNIFANYLKNFGIKKGSIVALLTKHSIETIISIIAILKSGNSYLPIDPEHPNDRILFMLEDSKTPCLVTNLTNIDYFPNDKIIYLDSNIFESDLKSFQNEKNELAYIMYTSGSTGKPKGVKVTNKNLLNYILWVKKYGLLENKKTIYPFYTSLSFDLTITSIFLPLISGNQIEVYKNEDHKFAIKKIIDDKKANVIKLTPSHLKLMKEFINNDCIIEKIITLGEPLNTDLAKEIYNKLNGKVEIINQYGPTEATVGCMYHTFNPDKDLRKSIPIGIPADNTFIYLLNENLEEVAVNNSGEIYISGDFVAQGYLNRDELTKERFLRDPFRKDYIMYKTGDLGLRLENFEIEYLERIDAQVKFRGYRIELGEIESLLLKYKDIKECIVLLREQTFSNNDTFKYLIAYYKSDYELDTQEIKNFLSKELPYYMIPSKYINIKEFPLTVNGKINKKELLKFDDNDNYISENNFINVDDSLVKKLKESISKVISIKEKDIKEDSNIFNLGIDSLSLTMLFSILIKEIPIKDENYLINNISNILKDPTIKNLLDIIKKV
ncbi:MAG: non-ribosomal peptide synthetase [Candidatus Sericytochromatia bacterium]